MSESSDAADEFLAPITHQHDPCPQQSVWAEGDLCQALCGWDNLFYSARIKKIFTGPPHRKKALVRFDGYGTEDEEEVLLRDLKSPPKPQRKNTSPPKNSARKREMRLREIYKILDDEKEESLRERAILKPSWRTTSRRLLDCLSPSSKSPDSGDPESPLCGTTADTSCPKRTAEPSHRSVKTFRKQNGPKVQIVTTLHIHDGEMPQESVSKDDRSTYSGFEDADFEKPHFAHPASSPKVPLVLSADGEKPLVAVPATINQYLWDYQRVGIRFLFDHYKLGMGAILGDDMGLGKTVQVIGFLAALLGKTGTKEDVLKQRPLFIRELSEDRQDLEAENDKRKVFLIVGPASVLYNWVEELETWGHFTVGKYHKTHKQQTLADMKANKLDIVVTTFETCRDNIRDLNRFKWDAIIADEAHKIKGLKAEITQALKALECRRRYGLTGTALQNHMKELWCILDWANPGCLGSVAQFKDNFECAILRGQKQDATKRQLADARKAKEKFAELRSQWFLRRTKAVIADQLPNKKECVVYCKPTSIQVDVYRAILTHPHIRMILTQHNPCPCHSGRTRGKCHYKKADDGRSVKQLLFSYLHMLLKTSNHIALLMPEHTVSENQRKQAEEICQLAFAQHPQFREQSKKASFRTLSDPKYCGKMKVMAGLLKVFMREHSKVLLFSLSTQLLDIIEQYVITTGYEYRRLDGKTPEVRRQQLVREFNKDRNLFLFLASTRAGGIGLNLTGANVVIIFDPNWNPTHDLQAQDRAYRLGQGRDVRVFRLITVGTIEENIYLRQVYKQQLDCVAVSEENAKRLFYQKEIFGIENMFKFRTGGSCLTMDILERNDKIESGMKGFTISNYARPSDPSKTEDDTASDRGDITDEEVGDQLAGKRGRKKKSAREDRYGIESLCTQEMDELSDISRDPSSSDQEDSDPVHLSTSCDSDEPVERPVASRKKKRLRRAVISDESDNVPCEECVQPKPSTSKGLGDCNHTCSNASRPTSKSPATDGKHIKLSENGSDSREPPLKKRVAHSKPSRGQHSRKKVCVRPAPNSASSFEEDEPSRNGLSSNKDRKLSPKESISMSAITTMESVSDVFKQCGVIHMHENRKLIGASRAEDHMTRCAIQDVYELHQFSQQAAANCDPYTESSTESEDTDPVKRTQKGGVGKRRSSGRKAVVRQLDGPCALVIGRKKVLLGQTPLGIRRKHFRDLMSRTCEKDAVALARRVLLSSPETQEAVLHSFYCSTDPALEEVYQQLRQEEDKQKETNITKTKSQVARPKKPTKKTSLSKRPRRPKQRGKPVVRAARGCQYDCSTNSDTDTELGRPDTEQKKLQTRSGSKPPEPIERIQQTSNHQRDPPTEFGSENTHDTDACKTSSKPELNDPLDWIFALDDIQRQGRSQRSQKSTRGAGKSPKNTTKDGSNLNDLLEEMMGATEIPPGSHSPTPRTPTRMVRTEKHQKDTAELTPHNTGKHLIRHRASTSPQKAHRNVVNETFTCLDDVFFDDTVGKSQQKRDVTRVTPKSSSAREERTHKDKMAELKHGKSRPLSDTERSSFDIFDLDRKIKSQKGKQILLGTESDEEDDIFADSSKWVKKTKKSPRVKGLNTSNIDTRLKEDDEEYKRLFETGKMGRKTER